MNFYIFFQIWTTGEDHSIADVINKEYKTIFSNYDAWYFDCGYAGWVTDGSNWCSPYKGILKPRPKNMNYCTFIAIIKLYNNIPKNVRFVARNTVFGCTKRMHSALKLEKSAISKV